MNFIRLYVRVALDRSGQKGKEEKSMSNPGELSMGPGVQNVLWNLSDQGPVVVDMQAGKLS